MNIEYQGVPIDAESAERLAANGLRFGLVDTNDPEAFGAWLHADARGFHGAGPSEDSVETQVRGLAYRRTTGVWDDSSAEAASPVSTVSSWPTQLTVPGQTSVTAWAISSVTVSPTHRRRGIARAMIEAELRTAQRFGAPLAMLTVSEATIYGRYGFAPSALTADWTIDTRRARWTGPAASGRVQFITPEQLRVDGPALIERGRLNAPGDIERWSHQWEHLLGLVGDDKDRAKNLRVVRYDDSARIAQGFAIYRVTETVGDFSAHILDLHHLVAATDDAYAGLWRYLIEMDLVASITAPLRSADEAFTWQLSDFRAARKTWERDHLWTRILDVKAALETRRYGAPGNIVLEVDDPLGFADGRFLLTIEPDSLASVVPLPGRAPDDAAAVALTVNELSALYLGGVSAVSLVRAGRITELREGSAVAIDRAFRSTVTPWLSIWF